MDILQKIAQNEQQIVEYKQQSVSIKDLKQYPLFNRKKISLKEAIKNSKTGIIAEYKRRSPSKPTINLKTPIFTVAKGYESAGVSGMSVLTNNTFFGGSLDDLMVARNACKLPLLRKEFIITKYQIYEAKAFGADAILLIAALLNEQEIIQFSELAKNLGLDVIIEIHGQGELEKCVQPSIDLIGVNNRNLKTFEVSLNTSLNLVNQIPDEYVKISESGIHTVEDVLKLKSVGYDGFLIGENFMKTEDPGESAKQFIGSINLSEGGKLPSLLGGKIGLKICGMKISENIVHTSALNPDFMGFIFYEKSPRFFDSEIPNLPKTIKKVGVFVNESIQNILQKVETYKLDFVQLHGHESVAFCETLKSNHIQIIKAFGIDEHFDFSILSDYNKVCDYFLFDTKTEMHGGSGKQFDWTVLNRYKEDKPYFLSGGIGLESVEQLKEFSKSDVFKKCLVIDVNSKFESESGNKKVSELKEFMNQISDIRI